MNLPNAVRDFQSILRDRIPALRWSVDAPGNDRGLWWIDIECDGVDLVVQWSESQGFGLFTDADEGYGDRPTEVFRTPQLAARRVAQVVKRCRDGLPLV